MRVIASVFEPQAVAYAPFSCYLDNAGIIGCALPMHFRRPAEIAVVVEARGAELVVPVIDVGPWFDGVTGQDAWWRVPSRAPLAERMKAAGQRTRKHDKVPNGAAVDLTYGAADALGLPRDFLGPVNVWVTERTGPGLEGLAGVLRTLKG